MIDTLDRRPTGAVGRQGRLELVFARRNGRTVIAEAYAEPPFRVGRGFERCGALHVIMTAIGPGILGGDDLRQHIHVESGARVKLTSQAAIRVHPSASGEAARLHSTYVVDDDAELVCDWEPLIPYAGSRLHQQIDIRLASTASLSWSDGFSSGRLAAGERWQFDTLAHELAVRRANALEYLERYRLEPGRRAVDRPWVGDADFFGTVLCSARREDPAGAERLHGELAAMSGLRAAVDLLAPGCRLVRLMTRSALLFHAARARAAAFQPPAAT
jgi:urease accessory protein